MSKVNAGLPTFSEALRFYLTASRVKELIAMKMTLKNPEEIKIFILYLLDRIGYPLCYSDLGTIVIRDGVIDYFAYFEYFSELVEAGHIAAVTEEAFEEMQSRPHYEKLPEAEAKARLDGEARFPRPTGEELSDPTKKYFVTNTGRLIARSLSENILMASIREKSYISAMRHLSLEKKGATWDQTFEKQGDSFLFKCSIKDRDGEALKISVRADTVYQLNRMRINFDEKPDVIMRGIIALLTGNVNYLFDE